MLEVLGIDKLEAICADQVYRKEDKRLRGDRDAWTRLSQNILEVDKLKGDSGK